MAQNSSNNRLPFKDLAANKLHERTRLKSKGANYDSAPLSARIGRCGSRDLFFLLSGCTRCNSQAVSRYLHCKTSRPQTPFETAALWTAGPSYRWPVRTPLSSHRCAGPSTMLMLCEIVQPANRTAISIKNKVKIVAFITQEKEEAPLLRRRSNKMIEEAHLGGQAISRP